MPPGLTISAAGVITGTVGKFAAQNSPYTVKISPITKASRATSLSPTVNEEQLVSTSPGNQTNTEGDVLSGATAVTVASPNADPNSFTDVVSGVDTLPPGLTINATTGVITGTVGPFASLNSPYTVTISATHDSVGGSVQFTWTVKQEPLVLVNPGNQTNIEGDLVNLTISSPNADPQHVQFHGSPPGLSISSAGVITGTMSASGAGSYTVQVSATHEASRAASLSAGR